MPTDTLYGVVGRAEDKNVVERIYEIRKRNKSKPCIILIANLNELIKFGISITKIQRLEIEKFTEPTSFIMDCADENLSYLHRGTRTLAFRIPAQEELGKLLLEVGPLIAPSANIEGLPPAQNISEAKEYFGDSVDLYIDGGRITGRASKIIKLHKDGKVDIIRE